jgi:penicillin-binding protein-related factor A (putative recombinase)
MVYAHLEPHQITNLFKLSQMGADAQVIAYHKETQQYYFYPFRLLNGQESEA